MARAKGKKAHRARVAKRNNRIAQEKYSYQKKMNEYFQQVMAQQAAQTKQAENDTVNDAVNDAEIIEETKTEE